MNPKKLIVFFGLLALLSCSNNDSDTIVDNNQIDDNLTGKFSLFPLALNPDFTSVDEAMVNDNALVGLISFGSTVVVYPYNFVTHNEIINDTQVGIKYAFSYCPITKSSVAFTRDQTFRASGYLYKNNLAPWDEKTETIWSQMLLQGIDGKKNGQRFNTIPVVETTWKTVKDYFPNAKVISSNVFMSRTSSPPDDEDDSNSENSPEANELVYGIITGGSVHIFKPSDFSDKIINVTIQSQKYIVYGNSSKRVINAFKVNRFEDYTVLGSDEFPYVIKNSNGIKYDILGRGTNGSNLEKPKFAYVAIWEAWKDFYSNFKFVEN